MFPCPEVAVGYSAEQGICLCICASSPHAHLCCLGRGHGALLPLLLLFLLFIHGEANECLSSAQPREGRKGLMFLFV